LKHTSIQNSHLAQSQDTAQRAPVTVIVPTLNEEINIRGCLDSVYGWADQIVVIDAQSQDKTVEIAKQYTEHVFVHTFGKHKYTEQKNWALIDLPLKHDWILLLDADERVTPQLQTAMSNMLAKPISDHIAGFTIDVRLIFLETEIKHGAYSPNLALRFFHRDRVRFVTLDGLEYAKPNGETHRIDGLIMHRDNKSLFDWITKQNERSTVEAESLIQQSRQQQATASQNVERRGRARTTIWAKLPLLVRPIILFGYSYIFRLGFLDGKAGFVYSFFLAFWYRVLVDAKFIELQLQMREKK
jgi:glycosyltransferase involved in cell wall biosynthesis